MPGVQLEGDRLERLLVPLHGLGHGPQHAVEAGLRVWPERLRLRRVSREVEQQRRVMVGDAVPGAGTHGSPVAGAGPGRVELWGHVVDLPDGSPWGNRSVRSGRGEMGHAAGGQSESQKVATAPVSLRGWTKGQGSLQAEEYYSAVKKGDFHSPRRGRTLRTQCSVTGLTHMPTSSLTPLT